MTGKVQQSRGNLKSKPLPWFRFYTEVIDDPKVQRLPAHLFKMWVNLLCLAGQNGGVLPSIDDIAFRLRLSVQDAEGHLSDLVLAGLIDITQNGRAPHNWDQRQFVSDSSAERTRKYREKLKKQLCDVTETAAVTPPEQIQSRADTETNPEQSPSARVGDEGRTIDDDLSQCKAAFNGSTDDLIAIVENAMPGPGSRRLAATQWLACLIRLHGEQAVRAAYQRFLTARAEGKLIVRPLPWLDTTAGDCRIEVGPRQKKSALAIIREMEAADEF